ncbi:MAG: hypothetical protein H0W67_03120 [Gemmatimonadales bacterium]|nr:hypothetical protein [Gemmatimonadales bacterium]
MTTPPPDDDGDRLRVYVNGTPVELSPGADASAAVRALDAALAAALADGSAILTDGRGIALDPSAPVGTGAILRVIVRARRDNG